MSDESRLLNRRAFLRAAAASTGMVLVAACGGNTKQANNGTTGGTSTTGSQKTPQQLEFQGPPTEVATQAQSTGGNGVGSTAVAMQGTSGQTTAIATQGAEPTLATPKSFNESPKLAEQVKAGKLPKVSDRLPKNPLVLQPVEKVGTYGGDWNVATPSLSQGKAFIYAAVAYEQLVRWRPDVRNFTSDELIPNVAESFKVNEEGTEFTFKLREGMLWSDGKPFTADDIVFWYEDVLSNEELSPGGGPSWLSSEGKPVKVHKADDYTVTFKFAKPGGLFLQMLATPQGDQITRYPAHYMKQFHKKYNPKVVQQAKQAGLKNWMDLFFQRAGSFGGVGVYQRPMLGAWMLTSSLQEGDVQQIVFERNPYYWKVDTEGNQLPYLDRVVFHLISDTNVMVLKALNGELDFQKNYINALDNKAIFYKNQQKGGYHFLDMVPSSMNTTLIELNLTTRDKNLNKVFNDRNFRIGLSHAIDRQEIINVQFISQGKPWQAAPRPESLFYNEKLATQYTEHDPKKANEYLDKVLPKKDAQGRRLGPDGKPFRFQIETIPTSEKGADWPAVLDVVRQQWQQVGIGINIKTENRDIFYTRVGGNEVDAAIWYGEGGLEVMLAPKTYVPYHPNGSRFAIPWATWYQNPKSEGAIEPPAPVRKQFELYDQIQVTKDAKQQVQLMRDILKIAQEQFWCMGISLPSQEYAIVKNDFHNVPTNMVDAWFAVTPALGNPCQFFKV